MSIPGSIKLKLIVAGSGALVLAGVALGASLYAGGVPSLLTAAQPSPNPATSRGVACQDFLHHLAQNVGKSDADTRAAIQQSAGQTIDDAVAAGKLTAAQAAKLKQALSRNACGFARSWEGRGHRRAGVQMLVLKAAAETLGITPEQLMQDLRQGKSISSLADGMTEDQFRAKLLANLKTELDALVKQGKVTQAQEDKVLARLKTAPIPFWNHGLEPRGPAAGPAPGTSGAQP